MSCVASPPEQDCSPNSWPKSEMTSAGFGSTMTTQCHRRQRKPLLDGQSDDFCPVASTAGEFARPSTSAS